MADQSVTQLELQISIEDSSSDDLDTVTRHLRSELLDLNVESAELSPGAPAEPGTKAVDPITIGSIAIAILPPLLPKLIDFIQGWAGRGQGRTFKFKGTIAGQVIEYEGSHTDLQRLLATISTQTSSIP